MPPSARIGAATRRSNVPRKDETYDPLVWKIRKLPFAHTSLKDALTALDELRDKCRFQQTTPESLIEFYLRQMAQRGCFGPAVQEAIRTKNELSRDVTAELYVAYCFKNRFSAPRREKDKETGEEKLIIEPSKKTEALARYLGLPPAPKSAPTVR